MINTFCTYFDHRYLIRGLTLYRSLAAHVPELRFHVLCFDERTHDALTALDWPGIIAVPISELEREVTELAVVKRERSLLEYYFTCTPAWIEFVRARAMDAHLVAYVDADLFFYSSPDQIREERADASIFLSPHRFSPRFAHLEQNGKFNVGLLVFRQGGDSRHALARWREQCIDWCFDEADSGRFGDQKYLDDWPATYDGVHVIEHPGAGLAPWNWEIHTLSSDGSTVCVDERALVFFHFHALRTLGTRFYDLGPYGAPPPPVRRVLYDGYIAALRETQTALRPIIGDFPLGAGLMRNSVPRYIAGLAKRVLERKRSVFLMRTS